MIGLAGFSDSKANFWAYFDNNDSASYLKALYQLNDYIEAEGPFDGVLAFSQGASLAAMHIVRKAVQEPLQPPPFKFAVLISCSSVYDPKAWLENGEVHVMQAEEVGTIINIPTAHIWGADDQFRDEAEGVKNLSRTDVASFVMHSGGHEVPRAISKKDLADCTKAMRRAVILATPCSE